MLGRFSKKAHNKIFYYVTTVLLLEITLSIKWPLKYVYVYNAKTELIGQCWFFVRIDRVPVQSIYNPDMSLYILDEHGMQ